MKTRILFAASLILMLVMPACAPATADCRLEELFCVGLVTDVGKINDRSFSQSCWEGLQRAEEELGARIEYIETASTRDFSANIATFADEGFDVVVTCGFRLADATIEAAEDYPDTDFIGVDQFQEEAIEGLAGLNFPEDQAGFLVGALAAMMSRSHIVGAVCGTDAVPPVWRLGEGYKAGAAYADELMGTVTEVFVVYNSDFNESFNDPEWGAETATAMIAQGADVVFGCGGLTGNSGIITAAQADAYVIGVDTDQYFTLPEAALRMLSSALKLITPGVFELIKLSREGNFPSGNYFGDAGYAPFHDLANEVPAEVKTEMEKINAGLLDGSIQTNVPAVKP
ncbi:MAG TPA: BMP family ABC transporter substrate-binding protein [Anaerolineales bacterium]|nr:BMP family ABC transporter substrate-binding protein [Anaerolineales bacterium]